MTEPEQFVDREESFCEVCGAPSLSVWCRRCETNEYSQPERVWHQDRNRL